MTKEKGVRVANASKKFGAASTSDLLKIADAYFKNRNSPKLSFGSRLTGSEMQQYVKNTCKNVYKNGEERVYSQCEYGVTGRQCNW